MSFPNSNSFSNAGESYVIEISGAAVGIVVREAQARLFAFHAASRRFMRYDGMTFTGPREAERYLSNQMGQRLRSLMAEMAA